MTPLARLRIGPRLAAACLLFITMMALLSIFAIHPVHLIENELTAIDQVNSVKQRYAINCRGSVHERAAGVRKLALMDDTTDGPAGSLRVAKAA